MPAGPPRRRAQLDAVEPCLAAVPLGLSVVLFVRAAQRSVTWWLALRSSSSSCQCSLRPDGRHPPDRCDRVREVLALRRDARADPALRSVHGPRIRRLCRLPHSRRRVPASSRARRVRHDNGARPPHPCRAGHLPGPIRASQQLDSRCLAPRARGTIGDVLATRPLLVIIVTFLVLSALYFACKWLLLAGVSYRRLRREDSERY